MATTQTIPRRINAARGTMATKVELSFAPKKWFQVAVTRSQSGKGRPLVEAIQRNAAPESKRFSKKLFAKNKESRNSFSM